MLDRATIERLSKAPEKNAPALNVALAEEGTAPVLFALVRCPAVGPEALAVIAERVAREGDEVGADPDEALDEPIASPALEIDRLLIVHPQSPGAARDAVLARHADDAFFVLAAATHPRATLVAVERAADWPAASPVHDRLWLGLLDADRVPPLTLEEWAQDERPLRREAAARVARDPSSLAALAVDRARQVRRAVASNRFAGELRARLAESDVTPEVRARAAGPLTAHNEAMLGSAAEPIAGTARFAAALRAMSAGGVLAPDVVRALSSDAGALDTEGALLAAVVLPRQELAAVMDQIVDRGEGGVCATCFAAGLALRPPAQIADDADGELTEIVYDAVKSLSRKTTAETRLTGKARLAAWAATGLATAEAVDRDGLLGELARAPVGAERMILARGAAIEPSLVRTLCEAAARSADPVPPALVELAWADRSVSDSAVIDLAARIARPKARAQDLPEDEVDFDPTVQSLEVLERVVLAATLRISVSPRAALTAVALDARRVRYILSAMPHWKGRLMGARLTRVLRQHAGALTAARAEVRARSAKIEGWTERLMSEVELSVALAVGHLTGNEVARRIAIGRQVIDDGLTLAAGAEARAALEGAAAVAGISSWASKNRTTDPTALAAWLLLEKLERVRASSLVATSIDALSGGTVVPPSVCDALAAIERREPGRLETIHPQSPRGRATLASAVARAYRGVGGMRDERQGP